MRLFFRRYSSFKRPEKSERRRRRHRCVPVFNIHEPYDSYMVFGKLIITKCKWLAHQTYNNGLIGNVYCFRAYILGSRVRFRRVPFRSARRTRPSVTTVRYWCRLASFTVRDVLTHFQ